MNPHLHIVAFNIPFPADYGGVIDVYHKIRALKESGVHISLHCFQYGREKVAILNELCNEVYYYPRLTGLFSHLSIHPYIIFSRRSPELLKNLLRDKDPILFEGLHSCYYLKHKSLKDRTKIVRAHNIEHRYYFKLFRSSRKVADRLFFFVESVKLFFAESRLKYANQIAAISWKEMQYFREKYKNTFLLNAFHSADEPDIKPGTGEYLLYHGNLSVPENITAVKFLIEKVFSEIDFPIIVAGKRPSAELIRKVRNYSHIKIIPSPNKEEMKDLIRNAQANIIISFQDTGIKLKLIESLFNGRHCIINRIIAGESGLEEMCETGNSPAELVIQIKKILHTEFDQSRIDVRKKFLENFRNERNAKLLIKNLFQEESTN